MLWLLLGCYNEYIGIYGGDRVCWYVLWIEEKKWVCVITWYGFKGLLSRFRVVRCRSNLAGMLPVAVSGLGCYSDTDMVIEKCEYYIYIMNDVDYNDD